MLNANNYYKNVIIGAGLTGLSAAFFLKKDYLLVEKEKVCGGAFNSISKDGYTLDLGERFIRIPADKRRLFKKIFPEDFFIRQELISQVYLAGRRVGYPFQYNLRDLDAHSRDRCLKGLILARKRGNWKTGNKPSFYRWIIDSFGKGIAELFMIPYNKKIWCVHPAKMSSDWFFSRQVIPKMKDLVRQGAVGTVKNTSIRYYPKHTGAFGVPQYMAKQLKGRVLYNSRVKGIDIKSRRITIEGGRVVSYRNLVSTMPLNELVAIARPLPATIKRSALKLAHNSVICIWAAVKGQIKEKAHWIYFPEEKYRFARLYFPGNFSKKLMPQGRSVVGVVITYRGSPGSIRQAQAQLARQLRDIGIIGKSQKIEFMGHKILPYGFCLPLLNTRSLAADIRKHLARYNVHSIGRYGEWKYAGMEHALEDGWKIALELH